MIYYRIIVLLTLLFLFSCSSISSYKTVNKEGLLEEKEIKEQSKFLVRSLAEKSRKLHDIAWPIMKSNIDSCLNAKINAFGLMVSHIDDLPLSLNSSFYAASPENIENDDIILFPMIVSVANNSPAHRSQVMEGDLIISINNNLVSKENYKELLDEAAIKGNLKIYAKRDDCNSGLAFGGNKLRKLEYIVPDAIASGADTLVSIGGVQSNHTRMVAATAAKIGMKCRLVQEKWVPQNDAVYDRVGNILLTRLMGADSRLVNEGFDIGIRKSWEDAMQSVRDEGGKPYGIPAGASVHKYGGLGYVGFAEEVREQEKDFGFKLSLIRI